MAMAMASSDPRRKKLVYRVKSSRDSDGKLVYSVFSCLEDVERHRHRRNPFDPKYIQAALSSFEELELDGYRSVATREELEAASTSVHVRTELIKSMKDGLVKLTAEAIKYCDVGSKRTHKKRPSVREMKVDNFQIGIVQREQEILDKFPKRDEYEIYKRIFGESYWKNNKVTSSALQNKECNGGTSKINIGLGLVIKEMEPCLSGNPNFVTDDEICFNLKKENMEALPDVLQRLQSDCEDPSGSEDSYADLSGYKEFICPVTKELLLDFEDNQINENLEESLIQTHEAGAKPVMNVCDSRDGKAEFIQNVNDHAMTSESVIQELSVNGKSVGVLDRVEYISATYDVQETANASGHYPFHEAFIRAESVESSSLDEVMEESFIVEDIQDDIENGEDLQENIEPEEIQDDLDEKVVIRTGASVHYTISNEEIDRLLQLRQKSKQSKHLWLVNDPEKLLLPDSNESGCNSYLCDLENRIESSSLYGIELFKQSLSKPGLDIIERYNLLRKDLSKIHGTLHFELVEEEEHNEFSPGLTNIDYQEVENMGMDQDTPHEINTGNHQHNNMKESSISALVQENCQQSTEFCWENFTWSILSEKRPNGKDSALASNCGNEKHDEYPNQHRELNSNLNFMQHNTLSPSSSVHEREHLSPVHHMSENCEAYDESLVEHTVRYPPSGGRRQFGRESLQIVDRIQEKYDNNANQHAEHRQKNIMENSMGNNVTNSTLSDGIKDRRESVHKEHNRSWEQDQKNMDIDIPSNSMSPLDGDTVEVEVDSMSQLNLFKKPVKGFPFTEMLNQGKDSVDMPIHLLNTEASVATENALSYPHAPSRLQQVGENQTLKSFKRKCLLDELITGAVMAECQLQQTTYSHNNLEPLSQLLSTTITSIFEGRNVREIIFKDLITAVHSEKTNGRDCITLQRYFIALLSLAHRHNMGNRKSNGIEEFQISITGACTGKLDEIIVHLIPLLTPVSAQNK